MLIVYYSATRRRRLHLGITPLELASWRQLCAARQRASGCSSSMPAVGRAYPCQGGAPIPPFDLRLGERAAGEGAVFLTSSAASEAARSPTRSRQLLHPCAGLGPPGAATRTRWTRHAGRGLSLRLRSHAARFQSHGRRHPASDLRLRAAGDGRRGADHPGSERAQPAWVEFRGADVAALPGHPEGRSWGRWLPGPNAPLSVRAGRYFVRAGSDVCWKERSRRPRAGPWAWTRPVWIAPRTRGWCEKERSGQHVASVEARGACAARWWTRPVHAQERRRRGVRAALGDADARLGWCRSSFENPGIHATVDQYDLELFAHTSGI